MEMTSSESLPQHKCLIKFDNIVEDICILKVFFSSAWECCVCACIANATQKLAATAEVLDHMLKANRLLEDKVSREQRGEAQMLQELRVCVCVCARARIDLKIRIAAKNNEYQMRNKQILFGNYPANGILAAIDWFSLSLSPKMPTKTKTWAFFFHSFDFKWTSFWIASNSARTLVYTL